MKSATAVVAIHENEEREMKRHGTVVVGALALMACAGASSAQVVITEVFENPPGSSGNNDQRWEYIELYGRPGMDLTGYAVALVKGGNVNASFNPPFPLIPGNVEIDEAFSLDGYSIGCDGFFVIGNDKDFLTGVASFLTPNPDFDPDQPDGPANKRYLNGGLFTTLHIDNPNDTVGNLSNDDSSTYLLVRRRPGFSVVDGQGVYGDGYSFWKDTSVDVNYDSELDWGTEASGPGFEGPRQVEALQIVDEVAWSDNGGKEYTRSEQHEISDTPGFNPDLISRVNFYLENPELGYRFNDDGEVRFTRIADEEWIYGDLPTNYAVTRLFDPERAKGPTDPNGPEYDGSCNPDDPDAPCTPVAGGGLLFDDLDITGFKFTPAGFNDHESNPDIRQFRFDFAGCDGQALPGGVDFPRGDFNFDGVVDSADLALITDRLGATLDDTVTEIYDNGTPDDVSDDYQVAVYRWQVREFQQVLMMLEMDMADGEGGMNAPEITEADVQAVADLGGPACGGDVTGDGTTDLADLNLVLANFGQQTSEGDADGSGTVDLADLNLVLANFGCG
jgi:hypothetical protein